MSEITKEWCEKMAKLEDGCEIGAGALAADPMTAPAELAERLTVDLAAIVGGYETVIEHPSNSPDYKAWERHSIKLILATLDLPALFAEERAQERDHMTNWCAKAKDDNRIQYMDPMDLLAEFEAAIHARDRSR